VTRALLALALLCAATQAQALATCTATTLPVSFSTYDPVLNADNDSGQGQVTVTCSLILGISLAVSYAISLSAGTGTYAQRQMALGGARLNYNLYTNTGRTLVWGDGVGNSIVSDSYLLGLGGAIRNYPVYGRIPKRQAATPGLYLDTITVTVTY
jgi:spore coat protein U-like protein